MIYLLAFLGLYLAAASAIARAFWWSRGERPPLWRRARFGLLCLAWGGVALAIGFGAAAFHVRRWRDARRRWRPGWRPLERPELLLMRTARRRGSRRTGTIISVDGRGNYAELEWSDGSITIEPSASIEVLEREERAS